MDYKNKYLKYKSKYLKYKNQKGGVECDFTDWTKIKNNGQHNCGIYIHNSDPNLLMKCGAGMSDKVQRINEQASIFPIQYSECIKNGKNHLVMQRMDGDITSIYFNLLPIYILNQLTENQELIKDVKSMFDIKTSYSHSQMTNDEKIIILNEISRKNTITSDFYNMFIERLKESWLHYHRIISKEIVKILLKLIDLNFYYGDFKFDNFAYKLSDNVIETDFRRDRVPKIFNKFFYVYIIDPESGLFELLKPLNKFGEIFGNNVRIIEPTVDKSHILKSYNDYISGDDYEVSGDMLYRWLIDDFKILIKIYNQYQLDNHMKNFDDTFNNNIYIVDPSDDKTNLFITSYNDYISDKNIDEINGTFEYKELIREFQKLILIYNEYEYNKNKNNSLNHILKLYNNGFTLSVNGKYNPSSINYSLKGKGSMHFTDELILTFPEEIQKILIRKYDLEFEKFDFKTIDEFLYYINH